MNPRGRFRVPLFVLTALCLTAGGCSDGDVDPAAPAVHAPRIIALTAEPPEVAVGGIAILSVAAEDADGSALTYTWSADAGDFPLGCTIAVVSWRAPATAGECVIRAVVSDGAAQARDSLTVRVVPPVQPVLAVSPATLDFGEAGTPLELTVDNDGTGTLAWTASSAQDWITATPASGETTTESDLVTVRAARRGLAPGEHTGTVVIDSNGGVVQVDVSMTVPSTPVPVLALSTSALDFGTTESAQQCGVSNDGTGTLNWTAAADRDWIALDPAGGVATTATDWVTVAVDRDGLAAGPHAGTVTFSSDGGTATLAVTLEVPAAASTTDLFFLHHSTGRYLIADGGVRELLAGIDPDLEFWDHDYNYIGLTDPAGDLTGAGYRIPDDNTDPDGLHVLWTTDNSARTAILANHQVIAFKSCYPASRILSDTELATRKQWYREMRDVFDQHPDKVFVVVSQPPLHRLNDTSTAQADRARDFAAWLVSDDYLSGHPNVVGFDLFDLLAHPDDGSADRNRLRYEYERSHTDDDSHPNTLANQTVAPFFAQAMAAAAGVR